MTIELKDDSFQDEILNSKELVLVDFWAPWCGPCKILSPIIDQLSQEMQIKICKMNIDDNPKAPGDCGVRSIPTLMLFKDGKQIASKVGSYPKNTLVDWINSYSK